LFPRSQRTIEGKRGSDDNWEIDQLANRFRAGAPLPLLKWGLTGCALLVLRYSHHLCTVVPAFCSFYSMAKGSCRNCRCEITWKVQLWARHLDITVVRIKVGTTKISFHSFPKQNESFCSFFGSLQS
jgi:hypothetical protein